MSASDSRCSWWPVQQGRIGQGEVRRTRLGRAVQRREDVVVHEKYVDTADREEESGGL